ncbi:putative membrane protein [Candidatus Nitrososphaera gargensis Ga9.2]|uniref:Putative membrane protein n=1 Tax=Nitrososphaera gargensis (strain Ga9.2) TaxID=1237085 RepID=K0IEC6_NITGG|nr:EMC3/TMCO1 family protein [Candidatus Nitrososphaera gargensis]AFU57153.1 putative membrane protein [Candidatus Nitrososphaera gargensis Ga9.2]
MNFQDLLMQFFSPQYTTNPWFPDMLSATIVALIIAVAMNFAFAMLRKKTTDIEKMNRVMKETNEWRKQYTEAIKKQDKPRIEELKKKQAYVNKMALEMQQQQMRPMLIYMVPSFLIWIFVFPAIFGGTVAMSPIELPFVTCSQDNVNTDTQTRTNEDGTTALTGPCRIPGQVYLWGWFLIGSFGFSGIISKITKTSMPSMT